MQAEVGASLISTSSSSQPTTRVRSRVPLVVAVLAPAVWAADQASKQWVLSSFSPGESAPFLGRLLQFTLVFNPGAAFSMGTGATPLITAVMAVMAVVILVAAFRVRSRWWAVALGFLLGGALGNLTDRMLRPPGVAHGHVVDFLMLPHFPVFNVADSFITAGAVMILLAAVKDIPFVPTTGVDAGVGAAHPGDVEEDTRG